MKKLRVYFKCSLLAEYLYFDVATPIEGAVLISALQLTVGRINNEHDLSEQRASTGGASALGMEVEDETMEEGWADWLSPDGRNIDEALQLFEIEQMREMESFQTAVYPVPA